MKNIFLAKNSGHIFEIVIKNLTTKSFNLAFSVRKLGFNIMPLSVRQEERQEETQLNQQ